MKITFVAVLALTSDRDSRNDRSGWPHTGAALREPSPRVSPLGETGGAAGISGISDCGGDPDSTARETDRGEVTGIVTLTDSGEAVGIASDRDEIAGTTTRLLVCRVRCTVLRLRPA
jgi:hypothetical protein